VHWILSEENPADILNKPVTRARLSALKNLAGMTAAQERSKHEGNDGGGLDSH